MCLPSLFKHILLAVFDPIFMREEHEMERRGNWRQAQFLRRKHHLDLFSSIQSWKRIGNLILAQQRLVFLAQKEEFFRECEGRCLMHLTLDLAPDKDCLMEKLRTAQRLSSETHQKLWYEERRYQKLRASIPEGPLRRALYAREMQPDWHLSSKWLQGHCAAMGGCCRRSCGCCAKPRNSDIHSKIYGHCFSYCICCTDTRGFDVRPKNLENDPMHVSLDMSKAQIIGEYEERLLNSYIWGLL
ncbi:uncharacterized protein BO97DRAFT_418840 [Aspergillus homomorphus CBS 101889]|uniref:Uncharacterized protein n=1 Tax=Aspergillus homomorphus (strain CBS 101889) TaxID=1450537 RepID=A0A395HH45_ASPHC|nr:hypothetical protein BO97DRAFT_418840 [Aspergillus homomorphus CBS 101889]RAL07147.1 hypothetical protein BO97DRAFT_418840 [Aspergillus homomorphus CBS 101889]